MTSLTLVSGCGAQTVYFGRTKTTVNKMYRMGGGSTDKMKAELAQALQRELGGARA